MKEKKKIGIVTHYQVHNHGAQLQLFALISVLRNLNYDACALTFEKEYRYLDSSAKNKYSISIKSIPFYINYLRNNGISKMVYNIQKKKLFDKFRKEKQIIGNSFTQFDGDKIIVGSDEVFSFETGVTDAFWGNGSKCKNIFGYSCSFGPTTINDITKKQLNDYITNSLSNFKMISARDENTKNILELFWNKSVPLTCDPVILYGYKDEIKNYKRHFNKDYILLYSYDKNMNTKNEVLMIREVARSFNLPIYSIGFYHDWCDKNINADPIELLGYFKNAKYIITDTFHGTVLSLITNSRFATFIRGNSNKLVNLLREYNLESRIFESALEGEDILKKEINYSEINTNMDKRREESFNYLESILGL